MRRLLPTSPTVLLAGLVPFCAASCCAVSICRGSEEKVRVLSHGPGAGHYLEWRGKPLLLCGDSITQGWMECGANLDQDHYVDALASRGINLLMLWAYKGTSAEMQRSDRRIGYDAPEIIPWSGSADSSSLDLRQLNDAYFERLKKLVSRAEQCGIVVLITIHDGWTKTAFSGHPFNQACGNGPLSDRRQYVELADYDHEMSEQFDPAWSRAQKNQHYQERFCARLIAELRSCSNVIYEMFNEGEWYPREQRRKHEQHFLAFFRARCSNVLLSNTDHITNDDPNADGKVDVVSWHPQGWVGQFNRFADAFRQRPPKPCLYSEPVPEFDGQSPSLDIVRRSAWETLLAGAGWVNQNDTSFGWDSQAKYSERAALREAAYDVAGHAARFFNNSGVAFWEMEPHGELAGSGICLARPGVEYVAYAPEGGSLALRLPPDVGGSARIRWFNPRTGEFTQQKSIQLNGSGSSFVPPFTGDAVLHVTLRRP